MHFLCLRFTYLGRKQIQTWVLLRQILHLSEAPYTNAVMEKVERKVRSQKTGQEKTIWDDIPNTNLSQRRNVVLIWVRENIEWHCRNINDGMKVVIRNWYEWWSWSVGKKNRWKRLLEWIQLLKIVRSLHLFFFS